MFLCVMFLLVALGIVVVVLLLFLLSFDDYIIINFNVSSLLIMFFMYIWGVVVCGMLV